jgi:hypothetical protein
MGRLLRRRREHVQRQAGAVGQQRLLEVREQGGVVEVRLQQVVRALPLALRGAAGGEGQLCLLRREAGERDLFERGGGREWQILPALDAAGCTAAQVAVAAIRLVRGVLKGEDVERWRLNSASSDGTSAPRRMCARTRRSSAAAVWSAGGISVGAFGLNLCCRGQDSTGGYAGPPAAASDGARPNPYNRGSNGRIVDDDDRNE